MAMSKGKLKQGNTPAARRAHRRRSSIARGIGLMLLLATVAWAQHAGADTSAVIGAGGPVSSLVFDPHAPTSLYAISRSCGGVKSTDGGDTWGVSDISLPDTVTAFAIDPITPSTRYVGTPNGVYKSTGVATRGWEAVNTGLRNTAVNALAIDPTVPTTLYAGTDGGFAGISKSTDGANNWRTVNSGIPYQQYGGIAALAIDPIAPTTLYAGGAACDGRRCIGLMLKSTNAAVSWQTVNTGLPNTTDAACEYCIGTILALVMDPTTPTTLYAGTVTGIYETMNGGGSWQLVNTNLSGETYATVLAIDPSAPTTLYAGTETDGLFKSTDGANTWRATGLVADAICGDGLRCGAEECDDGNRISGDGCEADCTLPRCGNGVVDAGEQCDNGNGNPNPVAGCTSACTICGNGIVTAPEDCDDGNRVNGDRCEADCTLPRCGNGIVDVGEECDNGNGNPQPVVGCTDACTICGNGIVTAPEQCDDGNSVNGDACETSCTLPFCGNAIVDTGEQCDDGNLNNSDTCDANCTLPGCGNGILDASEECDDGNTVSGDGCDANCTMPRCGNGITDAGEECDDANRNPFDGCTNGCTICGNGVITPPEECDDGNADPADGCTNACTRCGNGRITAPETCDDGNLVTGDGCDATCQTVCGNGVVDGDEECDDGGICIASTNAGTHCTADTDCPGGHCQPFGGDGCAANCTLETDVAFNLVPGGVAPTGLEIAPGTSGSVINGDTALPFSGSQTLTIGKQRGGQIPVVIKADAVRLTLTRDGLFPCLCIRGVATKTCGGTAVEADGVTLSLDCTAGFTAGDSVCQGQKPCTFVRGPGNSASGMIGCVGLDGVNLHLTQDAGGASATPGPARITVSGTGGSGAAVLNATIAIGGGVLIPSSCTGGDASVYGPDGVFCTDDDPQDQRGTPLIAPATTGAVTGQVLKANMNDGANVGPFAATGHAFDCSRLQGAPGDASGAALASAAIELNQPIFCFEGCSGIGDSYDVRTGTAPTTRSSRSPGAPTTDVVLASVLVAGSGPCVGNCDGGGAVTVNEVIALVNIALGNAAPSACPNGLPGVADVTVAVIIQAVNNALNGCGSDQ
jgi:cysteine-rich repeat protein